MRTTVATREVKNASHPIKFKREKFVNLMTVIVDEAKRSVNLINPRKKRLPSGRMLGDLGVADCEDFVERGNPLK